MLVGNPGDACYFISKCRDINCNYVIDMDSTVEEASPEATGMATVVLAEDHSIVREGIRALLTQTTEHEVVADCGDGVAALELVKERRSDVLITGLSLPGLDGLEVIRRVHRDFPHTSVVSPDPACRLTGTSVSIFSASDRRLAISVSSYRLCN